MLPVGSPPLILGAIPIKKLRNWWQEGEKKLEDTKQQMQMNKSDLVKYMKNHKFAEITCILTNANISTTLWIYWC